jgi:hypothetical protein
MNAATERLTILLFARCNVLAHADPSIARAAVELNT